MANDSIDDDFFAAIDRIIGGCPRHPDLAAKIMTRKPLRLNATNVAKEAGHSRSTYYERPNVLIRIEEIEKGPRRTLQKKLDDLTETNKQLVEEHKRVLNTAAAVIMRMNYLVQTHAKSTRRAEREAARPNPNKIVGEVIELRPRQNKGD